MTDNLANPLEELEKIPTGVVGQLVKLPGSIISGGVKSLLGKGDTSAQVKVDPLTGIEIPTPQRVQQLQKREKKQRQSGLAMMRQTISAVKPQNKPDLSQLPAYIAGKPGFLQDKKPLPPPVAAVKQKFSTGERKHGVGG